MAAAVYPSDGTSASSTLGSSSTGTKAKAKINSQQFGVAKSEAAGTSSPLKSSNSAASGSGTPQKRTKASGNTGSSGLNTPDTPLIKALLSQQQARGANVINTTGNSALRLLNSLVEASSELADHFTPALLKLAQRFTREHLIHSNMSTNTKSSGSGVTSGSSTDSSSSSNVDSFGRNRVMATPSLAIVDEWFQIQTGRSTLAVNNIIRQMKSKREEKQSKKKTTGNSGSGSSMDGKDIVGGGSTGGSSNQKSTTGGTKKKNGSVGSGAGSTTASIAQHKSSIDLMIICYILLSKCSFSLADHRRLFINLLVHCLESSTNIPLLLQITKIAATMITVDTKQFLSTKDKMTLLNKMATFDRLNEISATPLYTEYYQLILKLCDPSDAKHSYLHISPSTISHSQTNHFMAGLLAPDRVVRDQFMGYFLATAGNGPVARLQLVLKQDWQACGTRYWPVIAVEALITAIDPESVPHVVIPGDTCDDESMEGTAPKSCLPNVKAVDLVSALRSLAHIDLEIAKELWVRLFDLSWSLLSSQDKTLASSSLMKILASKFNKRDLDVPLVSGPCRTNAVQTLIKAIVSNSDSTPMVTPELILHLASAYDVWTDAIRICEYQVAQSHLSVASRLRWIEALSAIYKQLNEEDLRVGLSLENISQPETRAALTLEALGCVHEAQEEYFKGLSKAQSGRVSVDDVNLFELRLWEERWVGCAKQLCQWQLMNDFAKSTQNQDLLLDCAWKRGDWAAAKQLLLSPAMQSTAEIGCPQTRLQRLYIAILDAEKKSAVDNLAAQTAELALAQWQGLPQTLSRAHVPLMHLFHQFIEVKESIQMMTDIKLASQQHTMPNLKPSINTWRERLPNKWEPILLWDDILTWRSHMFQVVKSTFSSWSDAQMLASMHDSPWSVIKLAHTARKQHLPDVCLGALSKLYAVPAMDVQDAFSKLREQVSICYESSTEYDGGLGILNSTNLDFFNLRQKAEMFRLKALFLEAQGNLTDANQTFSHCLQICDSYGKGWLSWGHYCYRLFLASGKTDLQFAAQTIACYLQSIHHRCNSARLMIARVLWLLTMDDHPNQPRAPGGGVLIQAFETHGKQLPIWIWIIWIPQLLMALARPEAPQVRSPLKLVRYLVVQTHGIANRSEACYEDCRLSFHRRYIIL